jgi:hypothetical protein
MLVNMFTRIISTHLMFPTQVAINYQQMFDMGQSENKLYASIQEIKQEDIAKHTLEILKSRERGGKQKNREFS